MGLLDMLTGNDQAASPWGALYQAPQDPTDADKAKLAQQQFLQALLQNPAEGMGNPSLGGAPSGPAASPTPPSPFGDPSQLSVAPPAPGATPPAPSPFQAGAAPLPFGLAGPAMPGPQPGIPAPTAQPAQPGPAQLPAPVANANATAAPDDENDPIAVGKYQMPRIGAGFPDDDEAPAQRAPGPAAAPAGAPTSPAPFSLAGGGGASPGFGTRLQAGLQSIQHSSGLIPSIVNGITGLATGQRGDPSAAAANSTVQALLNKGAPPDAVQAAVTNPEIMKTLITQYFGPDKFQQSKTKNADGSESQGAFDPSTGKYTSDAPPQAPNKFSVDPSLTGKDRLDALKAVDPLYARKIESMVAGDLPMPTGVAALRPESKRMIEDALAVDGSTSASDFATRAATRKDYAAGVASRVTKSINTTIGHFATLDQSIDKLGNYSYFPHMANAVHDAYSSNMDPAYQKAKATFETNKEAAVKELDFALSGGHSSVSGSAELRDKFNRADSPEALHAAVTEAMSLLQKRLESHTKAFNEGTKSQRDAQDFIYPENQQAFSRMLGEPGAGAAPSAAAPGAPAQPLKPGNYVWTPGGGLAGAK